MSRKSKRRKRLPMGKGDFFIDFSLKNLFGNVILKEKSIPLGAALSRFNEIGLEGFKERMRGRRKANASMVIFMVIFSAFSLFVLTTVYYKDAAFMEVCDPQCPEAWMLQVSPTLQQAWDKAIADNKAANVYLVPAIFTIPFMALIPLVTWRRSKRER